MRELCAAEPDQTRDRSSVDLTVLVCTHNRARLLERCLRSLAIQQVAPAVGWEILVVDNRSTDGTRDVVSRLVAERALPTLRYVVELRAGVGHARRRGVLDARGDLVAFVDDDCLPEPDWVDQVLRFARSHPDAGVFGGRNELVWEAPPGPLAELYGESLGRQDLGDVALRMPVTDWRMPVGAGLVVRRQAVTASGWVERGVLRGRLPRGSGAGEDTEIGLYVRHAGWEVWYAPALRLRHVIPRHRTTLAHLRGLNGASGGPRCTSGLSREARTPAGDSREWPGRSASSGTCSRDSRKGSSASGTSARRGSSG